MTTQRKKADLKIRSACLGILRVKGNHTVDDIATEIHKIHKVFKISSKVNVMIADSGSNFLKALKIFVDYSLIVVYLLQQLVKDYSAQHTLIQHFHF
jgi:DNA integrity scanning protein DisA with diadenylate cyclase activity